MFECAEIKSAINSIFHDPAGIFFKLGNTEACVLSDLNHEPWRRANEFLFLTPNLQPERSLLWTADQSETVAQASFVLFNFIYSLCSLLHFFSAPVGVFMKIIIFNPHYHTHASCAIVAVSDSSQNRFYFLLCLKPSFSSWTSHSSDPCEMHSSFAVIPSSFPGGLMEKCSWD